jgi:uncharacterized membrane protein
MPSKEDRREDDLYPVVYQAVRDALWDVAGTVAYALFLIAIFLIGLQLLLSGLFFTLSEANAAAVTIGFILVLAAVIQFLRLFDFIPSVRSVLGQPLE